MSYETDSLATIGPKGKVPETRMEKASQVQDFVRRLIDNDQRRDFKRSRLNGLVDGNPPYDQTKLRDAGRADACNVNWGSAKTYLTSASGAFYDLYSQAPGFVEILTDWGEWDKQIEYSRRMSEHANTVLGEADVLDYTMQQSQWWMVLNGVGPLIFEDEFKVIPYALATGDFLVPERTKSDKYFYEVFVALCDYYPSQLFEFIQDEEAAKNRGWDVEFTKSVIQNAVNIRDPESRRQTWEFYQQDLKNNSLSYYDDSKVCRLAHVFWKEFDGKITHVIVERESTATPDPVTGKKDESAVQFLFRKIGRYDSFNECTHPMYYDRGNGGYHHSVTGLGVPMYAPLAYENRLMCNLMDKAFAPKMLFKPTSAEVKQKFQMTRFGDYATIPPGTEMMQAPIQGFLTDGLAMKRESSGLLANNLSAFRQQPQVKEGNPVTKFEKQVDVSQASSLALTTYNRYYKQLDSLYAEIVRRLCNRNSTDELAKKFQELCDADEIPKGCFTHVRKVQAVRVIGQGSSFMRKEAVNSILPIAGALPEEGRTNLINDKIASEAGQSAVARYNPSRMVKKLADDQQVDALEAVAAMKVGVPIPVSSSQNPLTFAATFLKACVDALQSVQQGADPHEVIKFIDLAAPACMAHLQRIQSDPTRKQVVDQMTKQLKQLMGAVDKLKQAVAKADQARKQQQQKTQQTMNDAQLKQAEVSNKIKLAQVKTKAQLDIQAAKARQAMALADANTASNIHRQNLQAFNTNGE